ncbi:MAG: SMP-30/gluconolactonase/LRE family protein [Zavarzinella sp.]
MKWLALGLVAVAMNPLIADETGVKIEKLWSEGEFTEGPCRSPDGDIYFSDIGNRIMKFTVSTGKTNTYRDPSMRSNGLKFNKNGELISCEGANTGGGRRISITRKGGKPETLADSWKGKKFNSPNDLTLDSEGWVYFTDPRYVGDESREIDFEGIFCVKPDGTVIHLPAPGVEKPNGIVFSQDEKTLYVADNNGKEGGHRYLWQFPFSKKDLKLGKGTIVYDFKTDRGIDGMACTKEGTLVLTAGKGKTAAIYCVSPTGKLLKTINLPEDPSNCCFGGADEKILFVTAGKSLYRLTFAAPLPFERKQ